MIYKVITYFFLPCMILALVLSFAGVSKVDFGSQYMDFMRGVSMRLDTWSFEIPRIPDIPQIDSSSSGFLEAVNVIVKILNGFVTVINVLIMVVNVVIKLIQFLLTLLYCVFDFRDTIAANSIILGLNSL